MGLRTFLAAAVLSALILVGCSGDAGEGETSIGKAKSEKTAATIGQNTVQFNTASRDGSITLRRPKGWQVVRGCSDQSLLALASFPVSRDMYGGCGAGVGLTEIPRGEAWLGISELSPIGRKFSDQLRRRPPRFRFGHRSDSYCGPSFVTNFQEGGRYISIWALAGDTHLRPQDKPGEVTPHKLTVRTCRELSGILDSIEVQTATAAPVRIPSLSLDCSGQAKTLSCDRVRVRQVTRVPMKRVSIRILRWAAKTPEGWVFSDRIGGPATKLEIDKPGRALIKEGTRGMTWSGLIGDAGLVESGSPLENLLPVKAGLEVISQPPHWGGRGFVSSFQDVMLKEDHR